RNASLAVLREIGVDTGGSNVQFAINPEDGRMIIIEMNPRVSRSSALASKATGFPIAKVAAKLAIGYTLDELQNDITGGVTPASFEPSIDYVVTKIPRFAFEKFPQADSGLTTQMKSVGEVMAIGRTFQESLHKAIRGLETGKCGLEPLLPPDQEKATLQHLLSHPVAERLWYLADALRAGMTETEVQDATRIDPWFVAQIADLVQEELQVQQQGLTALDQTRMRRLKRKGFADQRLAQLLDVTEATVREHRQQLGIRPVYKRVDTCAAEFASGTAYLYSTYEESCESEPTQRDKIMVLGGGPNRIGQGIEFDYCCVHAALAMREDGYETIMVNCNPETVSTDYDTSDRLYFEPLTLEDVLEIVDLEQPKGIVVHYGGQTPLKLAQDLEAAGAPIIGTSPDSIDLAEDRERFQHLVDQLGLKQPPNRTATNTAEALTRAAEIGFPLVVRPSYVLGGRAMEIVHDNAGLERYMQQAVTVSNQSPVLLDRFLDDAIEVDIDAICDGEQVLIGPIMEHIEQAGVHSGDSACSLPPYTLSNEVQCQLQEQVRALAHGLKVVGLMNTQFAIKDDTIYLLEVNPRASRTVPFVSKAIGMPLAKIAARCMAGTSLVTQQATQIPQAAHYFVKEAVFPFNKFPGVDTILGPEMKSTGEVMGVGDTFGEAFAKAMEGSSTQLPRSGHAFISVRRADRERMIAVARNLSKLGFSLAATRGTARILQAADIPCTQVNKVAEGRPHVVDQIKNGEFQLIINTTEGKQATADSRSIRATALQHKVSYTTTLSGAEAIVMALQQPNELHVNSLNHLHSATQIKS
ncbi:MAG: carbamoyl-phosphate synthase large subunit, partial [Pseudomonadota bacterium]